MSSPADWYPVIFIFFLKGEAYHDKVTIMITLRLI